MSKQIAEANGLKIGEKVLYPEYHPYNIHLRILTVRDVIILYNGDIVLLTNEFEGYLYITDIYTKETILKMFER